ncbi:hypothetical protein CANINC_002108 [Pichia inconspicua]|uniref:PH domain-containing protein n=1 Tax=Pichia inconspicua TaxID=52247 RepID=A0A4V4NFT4_9ASCO|nr:hypothetical protein CANINC_002108 [[Candida] inconspicua]
MSKSPPQQPQLNSVQSPTLSPNDDVAERLIRLVSVGLKEATMDSPSFRASLNFMHVAILQCSQTINSSISVLQKYAENWTNFINATNDVQNVFSQHLRSSQFISSDITKPCMNLFLEGQHIINDSSLSLLDVRDLSFANMRSIVESDIPKYLELRDNFDRIQTKYDIISGNFMQLPKHYDPSKTKDDALQLFEIRKQYIHVSMSLWTTIKHLEIKLSKASTDTTNFFWKSFDKRSTSYGAKLSDAIGLTDIVNAIKQLNLSADLQQTSSILLVNDLNRARSNAENGAHKLYSPSLDIKDYDTSIINNSNILLSQNEPKLMEKHGWVFIKSAKLSGKGDVWIKRWLFVKNEVFGFLSISPDGQYVQETDKIGVLLVDFKYWPSEDRKFCFKISSTDLNIIIQVETSAQLRSWLTVFHNVKETLSYSDSTSALKRYPPALPFLKLEPIVAIDLKLVDYIKQDPQIEKTAALIELQLSNLSLTTSIETPLRTSVTEKITLAHLYLTSSTVPSALTANFWGYVNWGLYFALNDVNKAVMVQQNNSISPNPSIHLRYPKCYPEELRIADAELRALFEAYVSENELTLLKFSGSWSPNSEQTLFCTIFVTTRNFYVYSHTCGLISIVPLPITNFLNSDIIESSNGTTLMKLYFVSGLLLKLQLYTTDANIIKSKFNYILSNQSSNNPDGIESQVQHLDEISKSYFAMKRNKKLQLVTGGGVRSDEYNDIDKITGVQIDVPTKANQVDLHPSLAEGNTEIKINYASEMNLVSMHVFNAPAKAVFHMLFGDESSLMQCTLPLFTSLIRVDRLTHSLWRCDSHQQLTRVVWSSSFKVPCAKQKIEAMNNNKYYNIIQETPYLKFILGIKRKIYVRFVIYSIDSKKCQVMVYYRIGDEKTNMLNWFTSRVTHQIMMFRAQALETRLQNAVAEFKDEHKKIATAIKNYGPITKYDSDAPTKEEELFQGYVNFVPIQVFSSFYFEMINIEIEKLLKSTFVFIRSVYNKITSFISTHIFFLSLLGGSLILNLILIGMSTRSYWRERTVAHHVKELVGDKHLIERAISITEIDELVYPDSANVSAYSGGSECFWRFAEAENLIAVAQNNPDEHGEREIQLSSKLLGLRIERNEVLTKLNLLNYMERELILKEWNNWVSSEVANCEHVKDSYPDYYIQIKAYCNQANDEMRYLYSNLL